jgi:hypothetical protein
MHFVKTIDYKLLSDDLNKTRFWVKTKGNGDIVRRLCFEFEV